MNRIDAKFTELRAAGSKGVIAYVTAGDPDLETTEELVCCLAESGVAMVELGVPFSDPVADGPVIQAAAGRALNNGVTLKNVLTLSRRLRSRLDIPLLVMTYYNPVYSFGLESFVHTVSTSGLDGVIIPDLPLALGFGISRPEQVSALGDEADAVIIGSAIVRLVEAGGGREEIMGRLASYLKKFN